MINTPFFNQWALPFYLRVLHGNYATVLSDTSRDKFNCYVRTSLAQITPDIALKLICSHWREAIVGSWFAGLKRLPECRSQIGELLLASKTCFAGQSHAFALACYADNASVNYLRAYLHIYLARPDCYYDQGEAMAALMWIDSQCGTTHSTQFLYPGGPWDQFTADKVSDYSDSWTIESYKRRFWRSMDYCRHYFIEQHN